MTVSDKLNLSGENSVKDCFVTVNHIPKQYSCVPHLLHAYMYLKAQCYNCIFSRKRKLKNITRKCLMITDQLTIVKQPSLSLPQRDDHKLTKLESPKGLYKEHRTKHMGGSRGERQGVRTPWKITSGYRFP